MAIDTIVNDNSKPTLGINLLWMVAKSCTTWDGRKPVDKAPMNWCRISQPSTNPSVAIGNGH